MKWWEYAWYIAVMAAMIGLSPIITAWLNPPPTLPAATLFHLHRYHIRILHDRG